MQLNICSALSSSFALLVAAAAAAAHLYICPCNMKFIRSGFQRKHPTGSQSTVNCGSPSINHSRVPTIGRRCQSIHPYLSPSSLHRSFPRSLPRSFHFNSSPLHSYSRPSISFFYRCLSILSLPHPCVIRNEGSSCCVNWYKQKQRHCSFLFGPFLESRQAW